MRVLVEYSDGSQKVELDDGKEVIISTPYIDGSRKIDGNDGSSGFLTDEYSDGSKQAKMNNGKVYYVDNKNNWKTGKSEEGSSSNSSSGGELIIGFILMFGGLIVGLFSMAFVATPIIAPILLATTENARKKGDLSYVKKWESWSVIASIVAIFVVLGIAGMIGVGLAVSIIGFVPGDDSSIATGLTYLAAIIIGLLSFTLSFITGISPTAFIYLQNKEVQLRAIGKTTTANRAKLLNLIVKITSIATIAFTVAGIFIAIIIGAIFSFSSQPIKVVPMVATKSDQQSATTSQLNGTWKGEWTNPTGYLYTCEIILEVNKSNNIEGYITWTIRKSPSGSEQSKIGLTAIEYISGTYDPETRLAVFNGYKKDDPNAIISLDDYKLFLSVDSNTLSGKTSNNGDWKGILTTIRKP